LVYKYHLKSLRKYQHRDKIITFSHQTNNFTWILLWLAQSPITDCPSMSQDIPWERSSRDCTITAKDPDWWQAHHPKFLRRQLFWHQPSQSRDTWGSLLPCPTECPLRGSPNLLFFWGEWCGVRYLLEEKTNILCQVTWRGLLISAGTVRGNRLFLLVQNTFCGTCFHCYQETSVKSHTDTECLDDRHLSCI
jgi:hypothetical protein